MRTVQKRPIESAVGAIAELKLEAVKLLALDIIAPSSWTPDTRIAVCQAAIAQHAKGMTFTAAVQSISDSLGQNVLPMTVRQWIKQDEDLTRALALATEACAEAMAEGTLEIADNLDGDVARDRLRVDVRQRLAAQLDSSRWAKDRPQAGSGPTSVAVSIQVAGDIASRLGIEAR